MITQEDRDFAATYLPRENATKMDFLAYRKEMKSGHHDNHPFVQATAAYRITAEKSVLDRLRDLPTMSMNAARAATAKRVPRLTIRAIATAIADILEQQP